MAQRFVNTFTPSTPYGQGMRNLGAAMFGGMSPIQEEELEAKTALREAQIAQALSHGGYYDAQAGELNSRVAGRRDFVRNALPGIGVPTEQIPAVEQFVQTRDWGEGGAPSYWTPEMEANLARSLTTGAHIQAGGGNADQTAHAAQRVQEADLQSGVVSGRITPERYFQSQGKMPQNVDEGYLLSANGGTPQELGIARALIGQREASAVASRAAAGASSAHARLFDTQRQDVDRGTSHPLVTVADPEAPGGSRLTTRSYAAGMGMSPGADPNRAGRGGGAGDSTTTTSTPVAPLKVSNGDADLLLGGIDRVAGGRLDDQVSAAVMARAQEYYSTPGSPAFGNHQAAAQAALKDVLPNGVQNPWFGRRTGEPAAELPPVSRGTGATRETTRSTKRTPASGAPQQPQQPAVRQPAPAAAGRPAGKSDQQLIQEANAAIQGGAPREAVMQRLQSYGIQVN